MELVETSLAQQAVECDGRLRNELKQLVATARTPHKQIKSSVGKWSAAGRTVAVLAPSALAKAQAKVGSNMSKLLSRAAGGGGGGGGGGIGTGIGTGIGGAAAAAGV